MITESYMCICLKMENSAQFLRWKEAAPSLDHLLSKSHVRNHFQRELSIFFCLFKPAW